MLNLVLGTWRWLCQQVLGRRAGRGTLVLVGHLGPHHFGPQEDLDVWIPQQYDDEDLDSVSVLLCQRPFRWSLQILGRGQVSDRLSIKIFNYA